MKVNVAKLSEVLDQAVPGRKLVDAIRIQKAKIERDLQTQKFATIEVDGTTYKILPKS